MSFDSIPAALYGYKPTSGQLSIGAIAEHLEHANYQLCAHFSGQTYNMTPKDSLPDSIKAQWPKDTLVARVRASLRYCDHALALVSDSSLSESMPRMGPGRRAAGTPYSFSFCT